MSVSPVAWLKNAKIRTKLLTLPHETVVHTGHGDTTTIGAEAPGIGA